ncbi:MAG: radical SAM protein [Candidatus Aminicenantes bacterium]|nr:radical SAM protein [Candidatus Aminicenantes bacterium]
MQKIKFRFNESHLDSFNTPGVLNLMFLDLTNQCNLRCLYCFNNRILELSPSHMELELLEKVLQSKVTRNAKNWFISGGEPLCYPYLYEAFALLRNYGHRPKIATNGIALTPDVVEKWVSFGVQSVQLSIDTLNPSVFVKLNRGTEKNHRKVIENLRYAVQSPLRVVVSSVLTKPNRDEISDIMRFCHDLGIDSYTLYPNVPAEKTHTELIVPLSQMPELIDTWLGDYETLSSTHVIDMSIPCFQFSDIYAKWKDKMDLRLHPCGAGQYNLKITSEGKVSACICQDAPEFIVGDLRFQEIDEIWDSPEINHFRSLYKNIPECSACKFQSECRGGCRNEAFVFGNRGVLSLDPHCKFFKGKKKTGTLEC